MKVGVREMQLLVLKSGGGAWAKEWGLLEETGRDKTVESPLKPPRKNSLADNSVSHKPWDSWLQNHETVNMVVQA